MSSKTISRPKNKSYEIQGQKFHIVDNNEDIQHVDGSGFIDQWPAYSSKRQMSYNQLVLTKNKNVILLNEKETKLPNLIPKPKFLEYLNNFINNQLKKHNAELIEPNPMRLEIYREAFDWLIDAFQTYKPLFADIKREYDSMIAFLREEIRNLEPMKEMIWTISEERNQEILQIKKQEKEEITTLKSEKLLLMKTIGEMEANEKTLEIQIETLQRKLEEEHLLYRNEADARRLLIIDINDLKQQMEDLSVLQKTQEVQFDDDPVVTKLALEQAKKGHSEMLVELTKMKTDYADVVPKRDYEKLFEDYHKLTKSSSDNSKRIVELDHEREILEDKFTALHQQRDFYYSKYMELARSSTPRPEWNKCGDILSGGSQWWQEQCADKSSKDLVELLLQEINLSASIKEQVDGKGLDSSVMSFLRAEGKINLRFMPKRDVKIHIQEIWDGRKIFKEEQNLALSKNREYMLPPMADHIDLFFKKIYGIEKIRHEWAYSFYEFISKEKNDSTVVQFGKILKGENHEDTYWDEMIYLNGVLEKCQSRESDNNQLILKEDMRAIVQALFVNPFSEEQVNKLLEIIYKELSAAEDDKFLPYTNLFMIDDEGEYGPFLSEVKKLYNQDKQKYVQDIEKELRELGPKISAKQLRDCIQIVDPEITDDVVEKYISWCYESKSFDEASNMDSKFLDTIVQRLNMGVIKRMGPKI